jgi:hypothetical protein
MKEQDQSLENTDPEITTISLNENEKQVLIQLIDLAVKASGLSSAEAALHLVKKITQQ